MLPPALKQLFETLDRKFLRDASEQALHAELAALAASDYDPGRPIAGSWGKRWPGGHSDVSGPRRGSITGDAVGNAIGEATGHRDRRHLGVLRDNDDEWDTPKIPPKDTERGDR